jgi:AcrR family transcriptional regulator
LFYARGVPDVGIDEVIRRSGVAKATEYKHFGSKDDLVLAFREVVLNWPPGGFAKCH